MSDNINDLIAEARETCADRLFNRTYEAGLMRRLADALEARQPSEDDCEALRIAVGRVVRDVMNFPQAVQARLLGQDMSPLRDTLVDSVVEAGFSRDTVPDAVARIAELGATVDAQDRQIEARSGETAAERMFKEELLRAKARIAEAAKLHPKGYTALDLPICNTCGTPYPCPTRRRIGLNEGENGVS